MLTLCILDGFGVTDKKIGNAVYEQGTPYLDKLREEYPNTLIEASGEEVGLPEGQMGNSDPKIPTLPSYISWRVTQH
ncbi:MAG: hypothetical protein IJD75_05380 [Clostridia bacterium]|nr:hypothetical protein [Clostridia bacterium]